MCDPRSSVFETLNIINHATLKVNEITIISIVMSDLNINPTPDLYLYDFTCSAASTILADWIIA